MKNIFTIFTILACLLVLPLAATSAQAYDLTWDNYTTFASDVTVTATGGWLDTRTDIAGTGSLGVTNPYAYSDVPGEIGLGQSITFAFSTSQYVDSLSLSLLYYPGAYGDSAPEIAKITAYSGANEYTFTLSPTGVNTAFWDGYGTVANLDTAVYDHGGLWEITNPFGSMAIDSIKLTAANNGGYGDANSDYGFHAMKTSATPIPGAAWLLGSGLVGLVGLRRRMRD